MHKTKIKINTSSPDSIDEAYKRIRRYQAITEKKIDLFAKRLAELGVDIAQNKVNSMDAVFKGELFNGLTSIMKQDGIYAIVSTSEHSAFVEFGTGQLGEVKPYNYPLPEGLDSWKYNDTDNSKHLQYAEEDLWWGERKIPQGTYYWFYFKDGRWWLTQGMPSRPFMTETALDLRKKYAKVAKEVFNA